MESFKNKIKIREIRSLGEAEAPSLEEEKVNPSTPLEVAAQVPHIPIPSGTGGWILRHPSDGRNTSLCDTRNPEGSRFLWTLLAKEKVWSFQKEG